MTEDSASEKNTASEQPSDTQDGGIFAALKGMFSFFTMLPINIGMREMNAMNRKFWLVPAIGLFYGLLALLVFTFVQHYVGSLVGAVCALFSVHMCNRFLHLDGMIDIGDGLTVAGKREDHLRALKDTRIGAGGMATGLFVTLLTVACLSTMDWKMFLFIGVLCEIAARVGQVSAAAFGTPGNGMAGDSVRFTGKGGLVCAFVLALIFVAAVFACGGFLVGFRDWYAFEGCCVAAAAVMIISVVWGYIMSRIAERNFGMVNGDVLGATNESGRAVCLLISITVISVMLL